MNYIGVGIMESILDYKFLRDMGLEYSGYNNYEDLKSKVRTEYKKNGINIIANDKKGNKYYYGIKNISRKSALKIINDKNGSRLNVNLYLE